MSDSVGKISLDLEVQSDLSGQISKMASLIGKNLKTSLEGATKGSFESMDKGMKKSLSNMNSTMKAMFNRVQSNVKSSVSGILAAFKSIKMPRFEFPKAVNAVNTGTSVKGNVSSRGPPIDSEAIAKMQSTQAMLDNVNATIESQQNKLRELRNLYERAFSQTKKNKIQEQMLKTEASINRLIAKSDKLGFALAAMDASSAKANNSGNKLGNSMKSLDNHTKRAGNSFRSSHGGLKMFLGTMIKWGIIFPIIQRGIMAMATSLGQSLMTNQQFANSLAVIKTNLSVAFTPILNSILPALNALMSALATATTYIASFISALFGQTYKQSFKATQGLINAKAAMGAYGDTTEKAGKKAKKAQGSLMGFDEINTLNMNKDDDSGATGGTGGSKIPTLTAPSIDTSAVDSSMGKLAEKVKKVFATIFQPFKNAWAKDGAGVVAEMKKAIEGTKQTFKNFFDMLATPPVQGFLESLGRLGLAIGKLALFIYNNYILPLINWFIGMLPPIMGALTPIINGITNFINWLMNDGKPVLDIIITTIGSFGAAFLIVKTGIGIFNGIDKAIKGVSVAFTLMKSPIFLAILAIGAIIAIGILLWKNWDFIKAKASEIWESIKQKFNDFKTWLGNVFTTDWSNRFGFMGVILNGFFSTAKGILGSIQRVFKGFIDFIAGVFTGDWRRAWTGIVNIFGGIFDGIKAKAKAPLNGLISMINLAIGGLNKIKFPDWSILGPAAGKGINIPKIPYLAKGGIIDQPTLAMVGERGKEAVMPLENNTGWITELASQIAALLGGGQGSGNSNAADRAIEIIIQLGNGSELARFLIDSINKLQRQEGRTLLKI
ncbi:hypothetical protein [Clostridium polynesiense]|uniref:hypothetical protein n=1 Tax=Clostridium polynesiense TaxID=1325933 RepID=UPI0006950171|nr:hypothetical protein [Clostridium polynesiense]